MITFRELMMRYAYIVGKRYDLEMYEDEDDRDVMIADVVAYLQTLLQSHGITLVVYSVNYESIDRYDIRRNMTRYTPIVGYPPFVPNVINPRIPVYTNLIEDDEFSDFEYD